jgi:predicted dehydrogenase
MERTQPEQTQPVRIGLVGYGKGGRFFHAPLISGAAGCELAGVVTRSAERRGELERDYPGTPAYDDLTQLAAAGVDAVVISTPADTHVPLSRQALSLGLPVVCDKPFALRSAAARPVVEAAERAGVPLTVYQNRRFDADLLTVRALIGSGELGQVTRFESRIEQYAPPDGIPASGGGILFDLGAHLVDQALLLFGPVSSVYAELDDAGGVPGGLVGGAADGGVAGRFFIAARHASGVVSHLVGDLLRHGAPGTRFRVFGSSGSYDVDNFDGQADELMAGGSPAASGPAWGVVPPEHWGRLHQERTTRPWPSERGNWTVFYTSFARAVRGQGAVPVDPWDAVAGLEVLEAAQRSASTRQVVTLGQG